MGVVSKIGRNFQEKKWVGYLPTPYHNQPHQYQPFKPLPLPPTNPFHSPKSPPQKSPQPLKFQYILTLPPNKPQPRTPKLPKIPK